MLATFFELGSSDINSILSYVFGLFSDFKLLLAVILGVGIGIWIIRAIVKLF
jgi:hypothetical protein